MRLGQTSARSWLTSSLSLSLSVSLERAREREREGERPIASGVGAPALAGGTGVWWPPGKGEASQRSLHNEPIFRLLLKVAVKGTQQCEFLNFCGACAPMAGAGSFLGMSWEALRSLVQFWALAFWLEHWS